MDAVIRFGFGGGNGLKGPGAKLIDVLVVPEKRGYIVGSLSFGDIPIADSNVIDRSNTTDNVKERSTNKSMH